MLTLTAAEIYAIVSDENGWRKLPFGNQVKLGDGVTLGNGVTLGDEVTLGNHVTLGNGVKLGNSPCQVQCHPYGVWPHSKGKIAVGCVIQAIGYWERAEDPDELEEHPECLPWSNYRAAIALVAKWMAENGMA